MKLFAPHGDMTRQGATLALAIFLLVFCAIYWVGICTVNLSLTKGHVIGSDGMMYYEYLPSLLGDAPFNFCKTRALLRAEGIPYCWDAAYLQRQPSGNCGTVFPFGWALLASPFFALAHVLAKICGVQAGTNIPGYGFFYESITNFGAVLLGLASTLVMYKIGRMRLTRKLSLVASTGLFLASNAVYYTIIQASLSHAVGMFCISLGLYFWLRLAEEYRLRHMLLCSLFFLLATLVRSQLGLVAVVAMGHLLWQYGDARKVAPLGLALGVAGMLLMANWYLIFGKILLVPQGAGFLQPLRPEILGVLFSLKHGLFTWHPVYLLCLCGFFFPRAGRFSASLVAALLLGIAMQLYLNSIVDDWWAGNSFGNRRFIDILPLFHVGLVLLLERFGRPRLCLVVAALLIAWNGIFIVQYRFGYIPRGDTITLKMLIEDKFSLLRVERKY